jgi:spore coat protein U-like protein
MQRRNISAVSRVSRVVVAALALALFGAAPADADQCTVSTTSVSFGSYNVFATAPTDSTGSVSYHCTGNASVWIALSRGQSSSFGDRTLTDGADELQYNLFRDAARASVWGDGSSGTQVAFDSAAPKNTNVTLTIYGRIPAEQDVRAGTYTDTVSVIINF